MIIAMLRLTARGCGGGEGEGRKKREEWRTVTNNEDFVAATTGWWRASRGADRSATLLLNRLQGRFTVYARCLDPTNPISIPPCAGIFPQSCMLTRYIRSNSLQPHRSYFAYI